MKLKRHALVALVLTVALPGGIFPVTSATAADSKNLGQLTIEIPLFDEGGSVKDSVVFWELCGIQEPCWHYTFEVVEAADWLRVAIDYGERDSRWGFRVRPPGDSRPLVFDPTTDVANENLNQGPTTMEVVLKNAPLGVYQVTVVPIEVQEDDFRFRALLQNDPVFDRNPSAQPKPLLPNLVAVPPFKFTFTPPVNGFSHTKTPDRSVAGHAPMSCTEDETHESGATTCLRFGAGGFNIGDGPLRIKFNADEIEGIAQQVVSFTDGSVEERDVGRYFFHKEHQHFHYEGALDYELFRVVDEKRREIEELGGGHKTGYCMVDYFIADWYAADDHRPYGPISGGANCGLPRNRVFELQGSSDPVGYLATPYEGRIGWTKGWGDVYPNWRPGQYVDFTGQPDGLYLIRSTVDTNDRLAETNERDNAAYALVRVFTDDSGTRQVDRLEWGRGESPWDPHNEPLSDRWL